MTRKASQKPKKRKKGRKPQPVKSKPKVPEPVEDVTVNPINPPGVGGGKSTES